jgi:hypothetical protein
MQMRKTLHETLSRQEEVDLVEEWTKLSSLTWRLQARSASVVSNELRFPQAAETSARD